MLNDSGHGFLLNDSGRGFVLTGSGRGFVLTGSGRQCVSIYIDLGWLTKTSVYLLSSFITTWMRLLD